MRQREQAFRTLVEHVPDIVMRYDQHCSRVYVNPAYEREIGMAAPQALQAGHDPLWWGDLPVEDCKAVLRKVMQTGVAMQLCVAWRDTQGQAVQYQLHVVAEPDLEGVVCGALAIGRNITPLKDAERRLEASHVQLRELAAHADLAREEERKHIARELHDELGQYLSALRMQISVLRMRFGQDNPAVVEIAESMLTLVDRVIWVVRDLVSSLRPAVLDMGIGSALEWLGDEFTRHTAVACRVSLDEAALEIDADQTIIVFRMIQESLTNITRHAHASRVEIGLVRRRDAYVLSVRDNGRGFDPAQQKPDSFGLLGLRERAQMLHGHLDIRSSCNAGTSISVTFPMGGGKNLRAKAAGEGAQRAAWSPLRRVGEA
nr:PAS domain-containing sensor histidine kinase [Acidovorax sp. ACV01]